MLIMAMMLILLGVLAILRSGSLSGRVLSPEDFFNHGGMRLVLKHIFTHNPFAGYQQDIRIVIYGIAGLILMLAGTLLTVYFAWLMYVDFSR